MPYSIAHTCRIFKQKWLKRYLYPKPEGIGIYGLKPQFLRHKPTHPKNPQNEFIEGQLGFCADEADFALDAVAVKVFAILLEQCLVPFDVAFVDGDGPELIGFNINEVVIAEQCRLCFPLVDDVNDEQVVFLEL